MEKTDTLEIGMKESTAAVTDLLNEIDDQRNSAGGLFLSSHQTDLLLKTIRSLLVVIQQQNAIIVEVKKLAAE